MTTKIKLFLLVITLLTQQVTTFAQKNNFTGTWILNLEKSKLQHRPTGLTSSIFIIKQEGEKLNIVYYKFGANQNEFIADEVFKGRPQDHHNIWVFDREVHS